jgi:hypothetical protein
MLSKKTKRTVTMKHCAARKQDGKGGMDPSEMDYFQSKRKIGPVERFGSRLGLGVDKTNEKVIGGIKGGLKAAGKGLAKGFSLPDDLMKYGKERTEMKKSAEDLEALKGRLANRKQIKKRGPVNPNVPFKKPNMPIKAGK